MSAMKWPENQELVEQLLEEAVDIRYVEWGVASGSFKVLTDENGEVCLKLCVKREVPEA